MEVCRRLGLFFLSLNLISNLVSMAGMEISSWTLFLLVLVQVFLNPQPAVAIFQRWRWFWFSLMGLLLVIVLGVILSPLHLSETREGLGRARWILLIPTYTFAFQYWVRDVTIKQLKMWSVVVGLVGVYAFVQFVLGWEIPRSKPVLVQMGPFWRATGFFNMPLTFAAVIGMSFCVLFAAGLFYKGMDRRWLLFTTLSSILGIITAMTRGVWLAIFVIVALMLSLVFSKKQLVKAGGLLSGIVISMFFIPGISERMVGMAQFSDDTYSVRWNLWRANFEIFKDHPLLGVGYGQNSKFLKGYYERIGVENGFVSHAHNNYMQWLGGTGLTGLALYMLISIFLLYLSYRLYKESDADIYKVLGLGFLGAQLVVHFGGITEASFFDGEVNHSLVLVWGSLLSFGMNQLKSKT